MKKIIALVVFIQSFTFVFGQDKKEISVNLNHFALSVKDADQSA